MGIAASPLPLSRKMMHRGSSIRSAALALVVVGLFAFPVAAQSPGDLAKKTAADQEKVSTPTTTEGKPTPNVDTNQHRKKLPPCSGDAEASRTVPTVGQTSPPPTTVDAPAPKPAASTRDTKKDTKKKDKKTLSKRSASMRVYGRPSFSTVANGARPRDVLRWSLFAKGDASA